MSSPLRRPSRSVRVPGMVSGPVRLGHQSTGSFFVPYLERPDAGGELPQPAHRSAIAPRKPDEPGTADAGPADVGSTAAGSANAGPATVGPATPGPAAVPATRRDAVPATRRDAVPATRRDAVPATRRDAVP